MIYTDKIHIVADSLSELHSFAKEIGIKLYWFEGVNKGHPHYDIPRHLYDKVLERATTISARELLRISKKLK